MFVICGGFFWVWVFMVERNFRYVLILVNCFWNLMVRLLFIYLFSSWFCMKFVCFCRCVMVLVLFELVIFVKLLLVSYGVMFLMLLLIRLGCLLRVRCDFMVMVLNLVLGVVFFFGFLWNLYGNICLMKLMVFWNCVW